MKEKIDDDLKYLWHPYTQMKDCRADPPIFIERACGLKLFAADGNWYYDTISSWWCNIHGHCRPELINAMAGQAAQLDHVLFAGFTHPAAIELGRRLVELAGRSLGKVFFSDNGSTAVETALKMSFQYWQSAGKHEKRRFLGLDLGYHGDTVGAMSLSGVDLFNERFRPLMFPTLKAPTPYCYRCPFGKKGYGRCSLECAEALGKILHREHGNICAVVLEPLLLAAGGMVVYPAEYLKAARRLTETYGVHLILDEVATGFGRTGRMFAFHHTDIEPDFLCLSKGITAGILPFGATLTRDDIYDAFYGDYSEKKTFFHGHTYTANPIASKVALESLKLFEDGVLLEGVRRKAAYLRDSLEDLRQMPFIGDVRGIGLVGALELVRNKDTKEPFSFEERPGLEIYREGLRRHLILRPLGNIVYLYLPLSVRQPELEYIIRNTREAIETFSRRRKAGKAAVT